MFSNLGWTEILVIVLIALFIFGPEKFPKLLADMGKGVRKVRRMAANATADLKRETGMDIDVEDLRPKTFIRKHVLSEADEEAIKNPLKSAFDGLGEDADEITRDLDGSKRRGSSLPASRRAETGETSSTGSSGSEGGAARFDEDAT